MRKAVDDHLFRISAARFVAREGRCATSLPGAGYATLSRGAEQEQPPSSASLGLKSHSADFDQLKGKLQPFLVITKPTLLALSQLVPLRLDFGEEELLLFEYQQVWPSGSAGPVVFNQIPKHLQDRTGRKNIDQLSRNLNLLTPMPP